MKIFISAATSQFKKCRDALASDLRAVGATEVKVQEDFTQGSSTLLDKLETYIAECDRVIVLVGEAFGAEPTAAETPSCASRRSYTQWEYCFGRGERLNGQRAKRKEVFIYFASAEFLRSQPIDQSDEVAKLQRTFAEAIVSSGEDRQEFSSLEELRALVLRDGFRLPQSMLKPRNLPYESLGKLFKGRDGFLSDLHSRILNKVEMDGRAKPVAITQTARQAICGLGGIGKTRLAVEYALRYADDYSALLFVVADSADHLHRGIADLALVLDLKEVTSQQDEAMRFKAAIRWLMEHPGWCLILDNVDDESAATACEDLVSKLYGGHIIITSRLTKWSMSGIEALDLDVLDASSARELLLERTPRRFKTPTDFQAADHLASLLDGLALGLEQAGAFINTEQCSIPEYVSHWQNGEAEVTEWFDQRVMKYPKSVALTWNATIQRIGPAAEALLRLLSCFAAAPIPSRVFTSSEGQKCVTRLFTEVAGQDGQVVLRPLLTRLASFSMVKKISAGEEQCLSLHRVVRDITWHRVPVAQQAVLLEAAAEVFNAAAPHEADRFENWATWRVLRPHAESIWASLKLLPKQHWNIRLLHGLALYYLGQNRDKEGEELQRCTCELMAERLGADKPEVLEAKNDLGLLLSDEQERLKVLREALLGLEVAYEKDQNPTTEILLLASAYNVALYLGDDGDAPQEAEALLRRCAAGFTVSPEAGPNHWRTLLTNRALANRLWKSGKHQDAEDLARRTLDLSKASSQLGPNHKDTLDSIRQVGMFYSAKGELEAAEQLFRSELAARERAPGLGPQHESTLDCLGRLLGTMWKLRKVQPAESLCSARYRQWRDALGPDHTNTVACANFLIKILALNDKTEEARCIEVDCRLALARRDYYEMQAKSGGETKEMLNSMLILAGMLRDANSATEAESMYRRLIAGLRCYGEDEGEALAVALNNYGLLHRDQGKLEEALRCYEEALDLDEKLRGLGNPKHPKIPHRLNNVAMVLMMLGKTEGAKAHLARAWKLKEGNHDVTSVRILWVRLAVALLSKEPSEVFIGQMKTLFQMNGPRLAHEVDDYWNVQSVLCFLRNRLSPEPEQLLETLVDIINSSWHFHMEAQGGASQEAKHKAYATLEELKEWREQGPLPLESPREISSSVEEVEDGGCPLKQSSQILP
jgi:tetratricopeptide (TPR) repeat protein